ncbi:MAG: hypothetical protein PHQ50_06540 [Eubacteriales bacterium]|nr:hypothetical protein [Eubacteriales bacterium]MDD3349462.1 hypothetical protein [Eubacteriales bacterium]
MAEFTTSKGYEAKLVPARCRQGKCCKVMINYETGWRTVLSIINPGKTPESVLIDRVKDKY